VLPNKISLYLSDTTPQPSNEVDALMAKLKANATLGSHFARWVRMLLRAEHQQISAVRASLTALKTARGLQTIFGQ